MTLVPFPSLDQVMAELLCLQNSIVAREVLARLEIGLKSEETRSLLINRLRELVENPSEDLLVNKTIYRLLLVLGKLYPRNQYENGRPIDPISLTYIEEEHLFISIDCYQWSIIELSKYYKTMNEYRNPVIGIPFSEKDVVRMRKIATKSGVDISLHVVEQEFVANLQRAQNANAGSSLLGMFSLFKLRLPSASFLGDSIQNLQMSKMLMPFVPR